MEIDFDKMQGLAPAVIQDAATGELLMVGFMNQVALQTTLRTGFVTFYSRARQTLWTKGETSGNRLEVVTAWTDCDRDTVLLARCAIRGRDPASRRNFRWARWRQARRRPRKRRHGDETPAGDSEG